MWGNILTEVSYIQNFNMGFTNHRADVLIHLTQYQYWWWFWFSFIWVLYYFLVARVFRYRTLKFNPRIPSTLRPRGKWGDLLTCLIPISWCVNILVNSNFILRLIEWQSESSLFTLRIRAKQWYWVYKLDLRNISDIFSAPRNIGRNKWQFVIFGDLQTAEDYLHIMQMRAYNNWSKEFWSELGKKAIKKNRFKLLTTVDSYKDIDTVVFNKLPNKGKTISIKSKAFNFFSNNRGVVNNLIQNSSLTHNLQTHIIDKNLTNTTIVFLNKNHQTVRLTPQHKKIPLSEQPRVDFKVSSFINPQHFLYKIPSDLSLDLKSPELIYGQNLTTTATNTTNIFLKKSLYGCVNDLSTTITHPELDDETRILKRGAGKVTPLRILKKPKNDSFLKHSVGVIDTDLFLFRFNDKKTTIANKPIKANVYLTFKQKRYSQRVNISKKTKTYTSEIDFLQHKYSGNPFLKNTAIIEENFGNPTRQYRMVKKAKNRLDNVRIANWNRLLRSRRVLVLPAHVNITVITNSFDLVHSWFIPGLGLKMDCLPGRATHHTLYIDNVGLYYGQCAEICGRYHHHMPIRICALPFEHFLVWWHTFGLPKFLFPSSKSSSGLASTKYLNRKFSW